MALSIAINWPRLLVFAVAYVSILMVIVTYGRYKKIHSTAYWILGMVVALVAANLITFFVLR